MKSYAHLRNWCFKVMKFWQVSANPRKTYEAKHDTFWSVGLVKTGFCECSIFILFAHNLYMINYKRIHEVLKISSYQRRDEFTKSIVSSCWLGIARYTWSSTLNWIQHKKHELLRPETTRLNQPSKRLVWDRWLDDGRKWG